MRQLYACLICLIVFSPAMSQEVLETGGKKMPATWIDKDTKHRIVRLSAPLVGSSLSFYFHNNPFIGNEMIFYNTRNQKPEEVTDMKSQPAGPGNTNNRQIFSVDLATLKTRQLTNEVSAMNGEVVCQKTGTVFFQIKDSVFSLEVDGGDKVANVSEVSRVSKVSKVSKASNVSKVDNETGVSERKFPKPKLVFVFPPDFRSSISAVNVDGTLLGGSRATDAEKEILRNNPNKSSYFNLIYDAHLPKTLFTIDVKTGKLNKIFTDSAWLNHVQFSSTDPSLMMFCHEGPWHKVNRVWTIDVNTKKITQIHKRTMDMEIWGHEWFGKNGKTIWFDLQQPRGQKFYVGGYDIATGKEKKYELPRNDWSVHYNSNRDETLFAGDGGDPGSVAKSPDGQWINLFRPNGDQFITEKLVNMKHHQYRLEPNVHFSPDEKWIIFRANFEGDAGVYAVEIEKSKK